MPLPQAAPEGAGSPNGEHFSYCPTPCGTRWHAYIAGPAQWVWCHEPKRTKPCLTILTNRAVACPWCGTDKPVVRKAYVPLYRAADWTPRCVIVTDLYEDVIAKFKLHERVTLGKEDEQGDPVWIVRAVEQRPDFATTKSYRRNPVDLTNSLLRIWGNDDLKRWYAGIGSGEPIPASDNELSPVPGQRVTDWKTFVKLGSVGAMEGAVANPAAHRNEAFVADLKAGDKPSKNGKHKPTG